MLEKSGMHFRTPRVRLRLSCSHVWKLSYIKKLLSTFANLKAGFRTDNSQCWLGFFCSVIVDDALRAQGRARGSLEKGKVKLFAVELRGDLRCNSGSRRRDGGKNVINPAGKVVQGHGDRFSGVPGIDKGDRVVGKVDLLYGESVVSTIAFHAGIALIVHYTAK